MGTAFAAAIPLLGNGTENQMTTVITPVDDATRRRNRRVGLLLGVFAVAVFLSSVPFWQKLVQAALDAQ